MRDNKLQLTQATTTCFNAQTNKRTNVHRHDTAHGMLGPAGNLATRWNLTILGCVQLGTRVPGQ